MSVTIIYGFEAAQGKAAALLELLRQGREFGLTVEGCESYDVYQGRDDPHRFLMIETWASVEAHQKHFEKNVRGSGMLDRAVSLMVEPPDFADPYYVRL